VPRRVHWEELRNYPAYFGQASLGVCTKNSRVESATVEFMKAIGYTGPLDLGFRYDARDGKYKVNDVNPRIGAMFRCFVAKRYGCGARALPGHDGAAGESASTQEGRKWIVEMSTGFLPSVIGATAILLEEWIRSLRRIDEAAFFSGTICIRSQRFVVGRRTSSYLPSIRKREPKPRLFTRQRHPSLWTELSFSRRE